MAKSKNQQAANNFDAYLYRLMLEAEDRGREVTAWNDVYTLLRQARPIVRSMMTPHDRAATSAGHHT